MEEKEVLCPISMISINEMCPILCQKDDCAWYDVDFKQCAILRISRNINNLRNSHYKFKGDKMEFKFDEIENRDKHDFEVRFDSNEDCKLKLIYLFDKFTVGGKTPKLTIDAEEDGAIPNTVMVSIYKRFVNGAFDCYMIDINRIPDLYSIEDGVTVLKASYCNNFKLNDETITIIEEISSQFEENKPIYDKKENSIQLDKVFGNVECDIKHYKYADDFSAKVEAKLLHAYKNNIPLLFLRNPDLNDDVNMIDMDFSVGIISNINIKYNNCVFKMTNNPYDAIKNINDYEISIVGTTNSKGELTDIIYLELVPKENKKIRINIDTVVSKCSECPAFHECNSTCIVRGAKVSNPNIIDPKCIFILCQDALKIVGNTSYRGVEIY